MRKFSRWMSGKPIRKKSFLGLVFLLLVLSVYLWFCYLAFCKWPWPFLIVVPALALWTWRENVKHKRHMRSLAQSRAGEDICSFVRAFDCHSTDTWVLRAVYEEVSQYLALDGRPFPIRADDRWEQDLHLDDDDINFDLLDDIAHRARRSVENTRNNPFYDKVKTVRDAVSFLEHQPKLDETEAAG